MDDLKFDTLDELEGWEAGARYRISAYKSRGYDLDALEMEWMIRLVYSANPSLTYLPLPKNK